ncbi:FixH family protein [Bowmanella dokdonensis]|uniref:FixH family protein n=1 Tax=Bowmanella dokdonensis TaxID=751969 RepID=A0A939DK82_9ALTE|nr:FixH family protein [Bowmanella dokdonensis]MBN7824253.1 FixH family protein [Bowmanella dokdonensis]
MKDAPPPPWYKQFWPWFLIAIPLVSIILSTKMLLLATSGQDSMVIDDYYKEGKAINLSLEKIQRARELGIDSLIHFEGQRITLRFVQGAPASGEALSLYFQHPTLKDKDFQLLLTQNADGAYSAQLPNALAGKWHLTLTPFDGEWKVLQEVGLPRQDPIVFRP